MDKEERLIVEIELLDRLFEAVNKSLYKEQMLYAFTTGVLEEKKKILEEIRKK